MAGELKHASVGTSLTQVEFEATTTHTLDGITNGDVLYADGTYIKRLAKGTDGDFLSSGTPPSWATHAALLTGVHGEIISSLSADSDPVNNSVTLVDITGLVAALAANSLYFVHWVFSFTTGSTPDIKVALVLPTAATMHLTGLNGTSGAVRELLTSGATAAFATSGAQEPVFFTGWVKTGANAGNLQPQFAQNTADVSNTIIKAGAILLVKKVA